MADNYGLMFITAMVDDGLNNFMMLFKQESYDVASSHQRGCDQCYQKQLQPK